MTIFGQFSSGTIEPERLVAILAAAGLIGFALWRGIRWILETKPTPDPWDEMTAAELMQDEAVPLCHHCLSPHDTSIDFCRECGTPVGQYTNWLPFPQLFSIGHVLRTGTNGDFKRTPLTVLGFMLFSFEQYALFAPIYWIIFLRTILGQHRQPPSKEPPPAPLSTRPQL